MSQFDISKLPQGPKGFVHDLGSDQRVFKGVPAPTNLVVPPHMFEGNILTIGEDKEL